MHKEIDIQKHHPEIIDWARIPGNIIEVIVSLIGDSFERALLLISDWSLDTLVEYGIKKPRTLFLKRDLFIDKIKNELRALEWGARLQWAATTEEPRPEFKLVLTSPEGEKYFW